MRKRVFLKSPVRENRTPGSVRGLLGNWQSYRDVRATRSLHMLMRTNSWKGMEETVCQTLRDL